VSRLLHPTAGSPVERAWHDFLAALNSGYMYYGASLDLEVKAAVACNEALEHAAPVAASGAVRTPPTVWLPQRHFWNPGSEDFGPAYGYQFYRSDGDILVWTFVHDVSGLAEVRLLLRVDADGRNPLDSVQNETWAGGPEVGPWMALPMTRRPFPAGNFFQDPEISFFEMPAAIADEYFVEVTGIREALVDYAVEAVDRQGIVARSPIQHVWIGAGGGSGGGAVQVDPDPPVSGRPVTVGYDATGRPLAGAGAVFLHWGVNGWAWVAPADPAMQHDPATGRWSVTVDPPLGTTELDLGFHDGAGTRDNNQGQDWGIPADPNPFEWVLDGQLDQEATLLGTSNGASLWAGLNGNALYRATEAAGDGPWSSLRACARAQNPRPAHEILKPQKRTP